MTSPLSSAAFSSTPGWRQRLVSCLLALIAFTGSPGMPEANATPYREVVCQSPEPRSTQVWKNFEKFVRDEYANKRRLSGDVLVVAIGHALGRVALAQHDDLSRQQAVACLQQGVAQFFAQTNLIYYGSEAEAMRQRQRELLRDASWGHLDDLVREYTGVTSSSPAYGVLGASGPPPASPLPAPLSPTPSPPGYPPPNRPQYPQVPPELGYCTTGVYSGFSVAQAKNLIARAVAAAKYLPPDCYSARDYSACGKVSDLLHAAIDQLTQVLQVSRSPVGQGCRYCDLSVHGYSRLGYSIDRISRSLYEKGYRTPPPADMGGHYSRLEKEAPCTRPPPKGSLSISPVSRTDCPKHCDDAAPQCNYAYYVASTRTCHWKDDQSAPNMHALDSADIWDRANRRWITQADLAGMELGTNRPGRDYTSFLLSRDDPALCRDACMTEARCQAWTYVKPGIQHPRQAKCWLKSSAPAPEPSGCCVSGKKTGQRAGMTGFYLARLEGKGWRKAGTRSNWKINGYKTFVIKFDHTVSKPIGYQFYLALPAGYDVESYFRTLQSNAREHSEKACARPPPMCPCAPEPDIWVGDPKYTIVAGPFKSFDEARAAGGDPSIPNGKPGSSKQWRLDGGHRIDEVERDCRSMGYVK